MFERIKEELLELDPSACLPCNLTDEWLTYLAASADKMLGNESVEGESANEAASLAAVIRLIDAKTAARHKQINIPVEEMHTYMLRFRIELAFEEVHRKTDIKYVPATLETILTERDVETWKMDGKFSG